VWSHQPWPSYGQEGDANGHGPNDDCRRCIVERNQLKNQPKRSSLSGGQTNEVADVVTNLSRQSRCALKDHAKHSDSSPSDLNTRDCASNRRHCAPRNAHVAISGGASLATGATLGADPGTAATATGGGLLVVVAKGRDRARLAGEWASPRRPQPMNAIPHSSSAARASLSRDSAAPPGDDREHLRTAWA
jgi:hypothetical protein